MAHLHALQVELRTNGAAPTALGRWNPRRWLSWGARPHASPPTQFPPLDEGNQLADFFAFRSQLQMAVLRCDTDALLACVHPDIRNSHGTDEGSDRFQSRWRPFSPSSRVWTELGNVLALGGTLGPDDIFMAPYVFSRWPFDLDPHQHVAIVQHAAPVRALPLADFPVFATCDLSTVQLAEGSDLTLPWIAIRTPQGRTGYVNRCHVRSPLDFHAIFEKRYGRWLMTAFCSSRQRR